MIFKTDKNQELKQQKQSLIEANQNKIFKIKKLIDNLETSISRCEEELRKLVLTEKSYYKISLKNGVDCRESGLGWIIKKLQVKEEDINEIQFPLYLDKKSRQYLVSKTQN